MPLSPPQPRQHLHTRTIDLAGYFRDDGLWDIEAHIVDKKTYTYENKWRGTVASGLPVHDMSIRLTIDRELVVQGVEVVMDVQPYEICSDVLGNFQNIVGLKIGAGWNRRVREVVGGVLGCTHLAELLGPLATVTFQTLSAEYARELMGLAPAARGEIEGADKEQAPFMLNGCFTWSSQSPVVKEDFPSYYQAPQVVEVLDLKASKNDT
jgi:hypothetical protein